MRTQRLTSHRGEWLGWCPAVLWSKANPWKETEELTSVSSGRSEELKGLESSTALSGSKLKTEFWYLNRFTLSRGWATTDVVQFLRYKFPNKQMQPRNTDKIEKSCCLSKAHTHGFFSFTSQMLGSNSRCAFLRAVWKSLMFLVLWYLVCTHSLTHIYTGNSQEEFCVITAPICFYSSSTKGAVE